MSNRVFSLAYRVILSLSLILTLVLSACTIAVDLRPSSPYYTGYVGSHLILKQDITIQADYASVYIQNGTIKQRSEINSYYAFCNFELSTLKSTAQTVLADDFIIRRMKRDESYVQAQGMLQASTFSLSSDGGGYTAVYITELYLYSAKQPNVLRLTCSHWEDPADAEHLTVGQIQQTLGDLFELQLK